MNNYHSPVVVLLEDIKEAMQVTTKALSTILQDTIFKLQTTIVLNPAHNQLKTPEVDLKTRLITLSESHLSYLWCCCYAVVGLSDIAYKMAHLDKSLVTFDGTPDYPIIKNTLLWGRSLNEQHSDWPRQIANPTQTSEYVLNANGLLVQTVVYLIFHELGHLVLHRGMLPLIEAIKNKKHTPNIDEKRRIYNAEIQADGYAFDCLKSASNDDDEKYIRYLGAVIAHLSNLYLLNTPDTRGFSHPDLDDRLRSVIKKIDLRGEGHIIHMKSSCSIGVQLFMSITYTQFIPTNIEDANFKDFEDLQTYLFSIIDKIKLEGKEYHSRR